MNRRSFLKFAPTIPAVATCFVAGMKNASGPAFLAGERGAEIIAAPVGLQGKIIPVDARGPDPKVLDGLRVVLSNQQKLLASMARAHRAGFYD